MSSIAKIFLAGLRSTQKGMWLVKEAIEERGSGRQPSLKKMLISYPPSPI